MHLGLVVRVPGLVDPDLVDLVLVVLGPADQVVRVVLVLVARAVLVGRVRRDLVIRLVLVLVGRVRRVPAAQVVLAARVIRDLVVLAARVILVVLVLVARAVLVVPVGLVARRLLTCNTVTTTGVVRSGVARGMHPTASARRVTVRRLRLPRTASGGTVDHPPARRRPTGTGHRLLAAGTDRRLLAAGTRNGMGRRGTSAGRRLTTGRSTTTATQPFQCSIRCSVDGDSGSSATGFRCTDLTSTGLPSSLKAGGQLRLGWALETAVQVCRPA